MCPHVAVSRCKEGPAFPNPLVLELFWLRRGRLCLGLQHVGSSELCSELTLEEDGEGSVS